MAEIVADLIPVWLEAVRAEAGDNSHANCSHWIKPFGELNGHRKVGELRPPDLLTYRAYLGKRYAPSSANVMLSAAKRFVGWTAEMEYRKPIALSGVKRLRCDSLPDKAWTPRQVSDLLSKALRGRRTDKLYLALSVQYLGAMRPTELLRVAAGEYEQPEEGVLVLRESKTERKNGIARHVCLPPLGVERLAGLKGRGWANWQTYWRAASEATGQGPHRYRHSAASHLSDHVGAEGYGLVRMALGHYDPITFRYARPDFQGLRRLMAEALEAVARPPL